MVERHAFLRALTWLVPYDEEYNRMENEEEEEEDDEESSNAPRPSTWPPKTYRHHHSTHQHQQQQQQQQQRALASRIILKDCSCCFHKGTQVLFFAVDKPDDDATQMTFQIALVEMNPAAFRQAVANHQKRLQQRERQLMRQHQSQLLILCGVGFKLDLCETAQQRLEYKKHIVDGVIQRQVQQQQRQPHRLAHHKAVGLFHHKG